MVVIATFSQLQEKYNLIVAESNCSICYSNSNISFSIYFEKHFEIYVCFHFDCVSFRLLDMLKWLDFDSSKIDLVKRNQISNVRDIEYVVTNLCSILDEVLLILQNSPGLLQDCLSHQIEDNNKQANLAMFSALQQAWKERNFETFLLLVEENRATIMQTKKNELIVKQEAYAKKIINMGQGDGSLVPADES